MSSYEVKHVIIFKNCFIFIFVCIGNEIKPNYCQKDDKEVKKSLYFYY